MYCSKCGGKNDNGANFCTSCGREFRKAFPQPAQPARERQTPQSNKVIISGNGKGNSAIGFWWFFNIAVAVVMWCIIFACINSLREKVSNAWFVDWDKVNMYIDWLGTAGIIGSIILIIISAVMANRIGSTEIHVFENGVAGVALSKYFVWGNYRKYSVTLSYDQIMTVNATGSSIQIHAFNMTYKFYVKDAPVIQNTILKQRDIIMRMR